MDFSSLLGLAQEKQATKPVKFNDRLAVKPLPVKKTPKEKKLSENVKRFLEKQQAQETKKKVDAEKKKANLLDLRRENKKSTRTMKSMLQRTKSSNKAALAEAKNLSDTSVTMSGRTQCDEDDYGYESSTANSLYEKLMNMYEKNPEDPMAKFSKGGKKISKDTSKTIERVKNSLERGDEDESRVKRSGKSKESSSEANAAFYNSNEDKKSKKAKEEEEARKRRLANAKKMAAPPPSFNDLIKLAQQKHKEPVKIEKKSDVKEAEFERPMTKKEKEEYIRERNSKLRKEGKLPPESSISSNKATSSPEGAKSSSPEKVPTSKPGGGSSDPKPAIPEKKKPVISGPEFHPAVLKSTKRPEPPKESKESSKDNRLPNSKLNKGNQDSRQSDTSSSTRKEKAARKRSRSPSPIPSSKNKAKKAKNKYIDSDEDEYDSELDDFIDDSDARIDISAEIRNLFGYDRRKYQDEDDFDDRAMENNRFSDVMKEEARSAKIGLMEDLEDMKKEEEEKKRKKLMKMKKGKL